MKQIKIIILVELTFYQGNKRCNNFVYYLRRQYVFKGETKEEQGKGIRSAGSGTIGTMLNRVVRVSLKGDI